MNNDDIVTYALNGLSDKYDQVAGIIAHMDPFPDLNIVRSMVTTEEMRLKSKPRPPFPDTSSSSPTILLADNTNGKRGNSRDNRSLQRSNKSRVCFHFAKGTCRFGGNCKFIHDTNTHTKNINNSSLWSNNARPTSPHIGSMSPVTQQLTQTQMLALIQAQQEMLAQCKINSNTCNNGYGNFRSHGNLGQPHMSGLRPTNQMLGPSGLGPPGFGPQAHHINTGSILGQPTVITGQAHPTGAPYIQPGSILGSGQETILPHSFNAATLQDPTTGAWIMDTGFHDPSGAPPM